MRHRSARTNGGPGSPAGAPRSSARSAPERRIIELFRSDKLLVRAHGLGNADRCVVTFDNHGSPADLAEPGFGERFFAERGVPVVVVRGSGNHWYQYEEMTAALTAIRVGVAGHRRVMTYGSSMGGYAALRFADAVGATACLALSPQYSINPATAPFEQRWTQDATTIAWRDEIDAALRCACAPVMAYDPAGPDRRHAAMIAAATPVTALALPHAGHPVATYLAAAGLLERLVSETLDGTLDAASFRAAARHGRRDNPVFVAELTRAQPAHRPALAIALARRAVAIQPDSLLTLHILAERLTAAGEHAEALPLHHRVVEQSDGFLTYIAAYCAALIEAEDRPGALAVARRMAAAHGDNAHVQSLLAHVLWRNRRFDEAMAAARRAAAIVPSDRHYAEVVNLYRHRRRLSTRIGKLWRIVRDRMTGAAKRDRGLA